MGELSTAKPSDWLAKVKWPDSDAPISAMDRLWNRFDGLYPGKWRSVFANEQAIQNWREAWAAAFVEDGVTRQEIAAGLAACRRLYDWPPSYTEFLKACRPPIEPETAFHEAVRQMGYRHSKIASERAREAWSHPAVFWAAAHFGESLKTMDYQRSKAAWVRALDIAMEDCRKGGERSMVPPRPAELPTPASTMTEEERREKLERLKREVGAFSQSDELPPSSWEDRQAALDKIDKALAGRGIES